MRVNFDTRVFLSQGTGISRYTEELLSALDRTSDVTPSLENFSNTLAYLRTNYASDIPFGEDIKVRLAGLNWKRAKLCYKNKKDREIKRLLVQLINAPSALLPRSLSSDNNSSIYHSTYMPFSMRVRNGAQRVITIHDLIPKLHPELFGKNDKHFENIIKCANEVEKVTCVSENTANDLIKVLPQIDRKKIFVTPLAASKNFCTTPQKSETELRKKYKIPDDKKILLSACTLEPRKNLKASLTAWSNLQKQFPDWVFVLIGGKGWGNIFNDIQKNKNLIGVITTGYIPDEDLHDIYAMSDAFIYASLYEGFGLPVLEAMQSGLPVITSCTSSLPEVTGPDYPLVNPRSIESIQDMMEALLGDAEMRNELRGIGLKRAETFSWERTAQLTLDAYKA